MIGSFKSPVWHFGFKKIDKLWLKVLKNPSAQQKLYTTCLPQATILSKKVHSICIPCRHLQKAKNKPLTRRDKDNVPDTFTLIYQNSTETYIKVAGIVIGVMSCAAGLLTYLYMSSDISWEEGRKRLGEQYNGLIFDQDVPLPALALLVMLYSAILIGTFRIYRSAMYRLYRDFDTEQYIAVVPKLGFQNSALSFTKNIPFSKADMKIYPLTHLRWLRGDFKVKGRGLIVDQQDFAVPKFFHDIFGADYETDPVSKDLPIQALQKAIQEGLSSRKKNK